MTGIAREFQMSPVCDLIKEQYGCQLADESDLWLSVGWGPLPDSVPISCLCDWLSTDQLQFATTVGSPFAEPSRPIPITSGP